MPNIMFSHKEMVEILIKKAGLHEGIWMLSIDFQIGVSNVSRPEDAGQLKPAVLTLVEKIGLSSTDSENSLSLDAAKVNPRQKK